MIFRSTDWVASATEPEDASSVSETKKSSLPLDWRLATDVSGRPYAAPSESLSSLHPIKQVAKHMRKTGAKVRGEANSGNDRNGMRFFMFSSYKKMNARASLAVKGAIPQFLASFMACL